MNILVFGDSITQGFHDDEKAGWVTRLFSFCISEMVHSDYEKYFSLFNLGISGERSCDLIKRFTTEFIARQEKGMVTIFAIGINDSARNLETNSNWCRFDDFRDNMQRMINQAQTQGPVVLVGLTGIDETKLTPIPWFSEYSHYQNDRDAYDGALNELATTNNCIYVQTEDLFFGKKDELLPDGLHPNAKGHQLIYERVKSELQKVNIL